MTHDDRIDAYEAATDHVERAWSAIAADRRDAVPVPGEWSPRRVVHHLADSETTSYLRLRKLLAEDVCIIHGYDEVAFADRLDYDTRPVERSLAVVRAVRDSSAELLRTLGPDDFQREGFHTESGRYTLLDWLDSYTVHPREHAEQMLRAAGLDAAPILE